MRLSPAVMASDGDQLRLDDELESAIFWLRRDRDQSADDDHLGYRCIFRKT